MIRATIAVVDDEKLLLQIFSALMRQYHYHADFFSSPLKALDAILAEPARYQLVISDIRMPELDGIELVKKIRVVLPHMPVVFMTAYITEEVKREALELGNTIFLVKPFPLETTLNEVIPKFLGIQ